MEDIQQQNKMYFLFFYSDCSEEHTFGLQKDWERMSPNLVEIYAHVGFLLAGCVLCY